MPCVSLQAIGNAKAKPPNREFSSLTSVRRFAFEVRGGHKLPERYRRALVFGVAFHLAFDLCYARQEFLYAHGIRHYSTTLVGYLGIYEGSGVARWLDGVEV
jgi:hypothetical protein